MALKLIDWYNLIQAIKAVKKAKAGLASWPLRISCLDRCQHYPHWIVLCVSKSCLHFQVLAESSTFVIWQPFLVLNYSEKCWINLLSLMLQVSKSQKSDCTGGKVAGVEREHLSAEQTGVQPISHTKWHELCQPVTPLCNNVPHWRKSLPATQCSQTPFCVSMSDLECWVCSEKGQHHEASKRQHAICNHADNTLPLNAAKHC